jgi:hypothetical protein
VRPSMVQHEPKPRRLRTGRAHGCHSRTCRPCSSHSEQQRAFSHPRQRQSPKAARRMWRQLLLPGQELERRNARTPRFVSSGPPLQASTASRARCSHLRLHSRWTGHDHGSKVHQWRVSRLSRLSTVATWSHVSTACSAANLVANAPAV